MILVTGGLGFIGSHTTRALLDLGEPCLLVQRREPVLPDDLAGLVGSRVFTEQADVTDVAALREIGTRHAITGIVHLAGSVPWPPGAAEPVTGARTAIGSLLNVLQAASDWGCHGWGSPPRSACTAAPRRRARWPRTCCCR
jgi:UDP-glucose 4-epimerase